MSRESSAINMFSNSTMYKIDPRGGVSIFQISLKFKKVKYPIGKGGQAYFWKTPKFSSFLIMMPPLRLLVFQWPPGCLTNERPGNRWHTQIFWNAGPGISRKALDKYSLLVQLMDPFIWLIYQLYQNFSWKGSAYPL